MVTVGSGIIGQRIERHLGMGVLFLIACFYLLCPKLVLWA